MFFYNDLVLYNSVINNADFTESAFWQPEFKQFSQHDQPSGGHFFDKIGKIEQIANDESALGQHNCN